MGTPRAAASATEPDRWTIPGAELIAEIAKRIEIGGGYGDRA